MESRAELIEEIKALYPLYDAGVADDDLEKLKAFQPRLMACLADDIVWEVVGPHDFLRWAGTWKTHAGVTRLFQTIGATLRLYEFRAEKFVVEGDTMVVFGTTRFRDRVKGRDNACEWVHRYTFRGNKVARFWEMVETTAALSACHDWAANYLIPGDRFVHDVQA